MTSNLDLAEYLHNWVEEGGKKDAKVLREKLTFDIDGPWVKAGRLRQLCPRAWDGLEG